METIQNQNADQEESFLYGNFAADGHGFIVHTDSDAQADNEACDSVDKTMSRVNRREPKQWTMERATKLANRWFNSLLEQPGLSQEDMLGELESFYELAEETDARTFKFTMNATPEGVAALQAQGKLDEAEALETARKINVTIGPRRAVRNVARGLVHDQIVDFCGQEFYSGEHPVIESFAEVHSNERGSDAWLPDVDTNRDNWREPPSQAKYLDNKIANAKKRVYSQACLDLLNQIRSDKQIHFLGKMIHLKVNPKGSVSPFTKDEQNIIWATWKGFASLRKSQDPAYGLIEKIRANKINGKDLYQATQSLKPSDKDRVWDAWRRVKAQAK